MLDSKNIKQFVVFFAIGFTVYMIYSKMFKANYEGEATATTSDPTKQVTDAAAGPVIASSTEAAAVADTDGNQPAKTDKIMEAAALLPTDTSATKSLQDILKSQQLLISGFASGVNEAAIKNPNLQLRSDPIVPKQDISPFNQSSIQPDVHRKRFEIE